MLTSDHTLYSEVARAIGRRLAKRAKLAAARAEAAAVQASAKEAVLTHALQQVELSEVSSPPTASFVESPLLSR